MDNGEYSLRQRIRRDGESGWLVVRLFRHQGSSAYFQGEVVSAERYSENEIPFKQNITSVGTTCRSASPMDEELLRHKPVLFTL